MSNSVKLKLAYFSHWFLMNAILDWCLYFGIAFVVESVMSSKKGSFFEYVKILYYVGKNSFKISAVSRSVLISSPFSIKWVLFLPTISSDKKGFTVFQKCLLSMINFHLSFHSNSLTEKSFLFSVKLYIFLTLIW